MNSPIVSEPIEGRPRSSSLSRRRVRIFVILGLAACFLGIDLSRPAQKQITARLAVASIHAYQHLMSRPVSRLGITCRFKPTCSRYAEVAIENRGILAGSAAAVRRFVRCGPWTPAGTVDPPPQPSGTDPPVASESAPPYAPPTEGADDDLQSASRRD